ncbi:transketolase [Candidatus Woesearchaeota archaeon]|nr:transketolase [Candidatus Woesearchaeota archaeon]
MKDLSLIANHIRQDIIRMLTRAESGDTASSLAVVDILVALYFGILKHDPRKPDWKERDRLFVSNGQVAPALYATLAHAGYFAKKDLLTLRQFESRLQGQPSTLVPGVEFNQANLSIAIGSALAAKMDGKTHHTYCLLADYEHQQGNLWEAILFTGSHRLKLTTIIDRSGIQADGHTEDILPLESLRKKYEAFNWNVIETDGHNIPHIIEAIEEAKNNKTTAIICHTTPGKGVSFIENKVWHKAPTKAQEKIALAELHAT